MIQIQVKGVQEALEKLKSKSKKITSNLSKGIHNAGFLVEGEVKASIAGQRSEPRSVDTGRFLNSVNTDNSEELVSVIKSDVSYSKHLEYGTSRRGGRHHFENSGKRKKGEIIELIKSSLK